MTAADATHNASPPSMSAPRWIGGWLLVFAVVVIAPALVWPDEAGHLLTVQTIRLALAGYLATAWLLLPATPAMWQAGGVRFEAARWCWSLGWLTYAIHVGLAFHFYHGWSHDHAVAHTRQVSGWGEGIYVSHLFTLIWLTDAGWWWASAEHYRRRSVKWGAAVHAFMAFIVFNGTVVYESGPIRWASLAAFAALAVRFVRYRLVAAPPGDQASGAQSHDTAADLTTLTSN